MVGNGFTGSIRGHGLFVNRHTSAFLNEISGDELRVGFAQPCREEEVSRGLNDDRINENEIEVIELPRRASWSLWRTLIHMAKYDFFYLFFPGRWSRLLGLFALFLRKPIGIYVRGESFTDSGVDALLFRKARFVCAVVGLEGRLRSLAGAVIPIAPMVDFGVLDAKEKTNFRVAREKISLLFVGRVEHSKGVLELMEAANDLVKEGVDFSLKIVGGGPLLNQLRERVVEERWGNVELLGPISKKDELARLYESANVFVLPTHHEGFPRVLIEAMLKSCVIATTFVGGIPSVMKENENCLRLEVGDRRSIVAAVKRIAWDEDFERRLSRAAQMTVLSLLQSRKKHALAVKEALRS